MPRFWREMLDTEVRIRNLRRVEGSSDFLVDVTITKPYNLRKFRHRYLHCRGSGNYWEYHRFHRQDWKEVRSWLADYINAEVVSALVRDADKVLPFQKKQA